MKNYTLKVLLEASEFFSKEPLKTRRYLCLGNPGKPYAYSKQMTLSPLSGFEFLTSRKFLKPWSLKRLKKM